MICYDLEQNIWLVIYICDLEIYIALQWRNLAVKVVNNSDISTVFARASSSLLQRKYQSSVFLALKREIPLLQIACYHDVITFTKWNDWTEVGALAVPDE